MLCYGEKRLLRLNSELFFGLSDFQLRSRCLSDYISEVWPAFEHSSDITILKHGLKCNPLG